MHKWKLPVLIFLLIGRYLTLDKNVSTSGIAALGAFHEEGALGGQIQVMSLVSAVDEGLEKKDTEDRSLLRKQSKSFCN